MNRKELLDSFSSKNNEKLFSSLYGKEGAGPAQQRYRRLVEEFPEDSGCSDGELRVFSVPGRTELGGNHTDHNRGKVLAGSIQLDAVAVVAPRQDKQILFRSTGYPDVTIDISDLTLREEEKGQTDALVRGIAAEFAARGSILGGFIANANNTVLPGSGLSSSAAIEVLIAKIFDNLYSKGKTSALELAQIGQKAENVYFGKPCGLMDQTACASGGAVAIDFNDLKNPLVRGINFDLAAVGYTLCVVDTRGNHADLTPDYAAIPGEMKQAAAFFGKTALRDLDKKTFLLKLPELRKAVGDRAVLRAIHFFNENRRVDAQLAALENMNSLPQQSPQKKREDLMETFLALARESGNSSWELLQNIYSPKNPGEQGLSLALALTKDFLGQTGACRVHGGGFAGTIQAYIPLDRLEEYRKLMEGIFGNRTLTELRIRPQGAIELEFQQN